MTLDTQIASLPTTPVAGVTIGHATDSGTYKSIFLLLAAFVEDPTSGNAALLASAAAHFAATTSVHGIADTSKLVDTPDGTIKHVRRMTAAAYAALGTPDALTEYSIVG